jgi:hypothetical protein
VGGYSALTSAPRRREVGLRFDEYHLPISVDLDTIATHISDPAVLIRDPDTEYIRIIIVGLNIDRSGPNHRAVAIEPIDPDVSRLAVPDQSPFDAERTLAKCVRTFNIDVLMHVMFLKRRGILSIRATTESAEGDANPCSDAENMPSISLPIVLVTSTAVDTINISAPPI